MDQIDKTSHRAGSWWLVGMGGALALVGAIFVGVLWTAWQRAEETRRWPAVPCKVLSSQVKSGQASRNSPTKHRVIVRYEYAFGGKAFTSERIRRVDGVKSNRDDAEELREQFTPGQQTTCYVNPADPAFAILEHDSRAPLYSIWFPLLFVVGGLRMAWDALTAHSRPPESARLDEPRH